MVQKIGLASIFILSFMISLPEAKAAYQEMKLKDGSLKVDFPENWKHIEDVLGTPLTLLAKPNSEGVRAVVQVTPYGIIDKDDVFKKVRKDPESYYKQREDWLENVDGNSLAYDNFFEEHPANGGTIYSIGVTYTIPTGSFHEQTFYVSDKNKKLYFITSLTPLAQDEENQNAILTVARSIASAK